MLASPPSVTSLTTVPEQVTESIHYPCLTQNCVSIVCCTHILPPFTLLSISKNKPAIFTSQLPWRTETRKSRCSTSIAQTLKREKAKPAATMQFRLSGSQPRPGSADRPRIGSVKYTSWTTRHSGKERVCGPHAYLLLFGVSRLRLWKPFCRY